MITLLTSVYTTSDVVWSVLLSIVGFFVFIYILIDEVKWELEKRKVIANKARKLSWFGRMLKKAVKQKEPNNDKL